VTRPGTTGEPRPAPPRSQVSGYQWLIMGDREVEKQDALEAAAKRVGGEGALAGVPVRSERHDEASLVLVYSSRSGAVHSDANLRSIKEIEDLFLRDPAFPDYCWADAGTGACRDILSPLSTLGLAPRGPAGGDASGGHGEVLPPGRVRDAVAALDGRRYEAGFFLDEGFDGAAGRWGHTRSMVTLGLPLDGWEEDPGATEAEREEARMDEAWEGYLGAAEARLREHVGMGGGAPLLGSAYMRRARVPGNDDLEVSWGAEVLFRREFRRMALVDFYWAAFSVVAVWGLMVAHTRSALIASAAMLANVLSFPVAFALYRYVLRVTYFDPMHFLMMFIVLGIGADDVFVFTDAYKQSFHVGGCRDLRERIVYTMERSAKAIFITSFTTASAFVATAFSPIMPVSSFGIFAAVVIVVLWAENVLLMPAILAVYARIEHLPPCVPSAALVREPTRRRLLSERDRRAALFRSLVEGRSARPGAAGEGGKGEGEGGKGDLEVGKGEAVGGGPTAAGLVPWLAALVRRDAEPSVEAPGSSTRGSAADPARWPPLAEDGAPAPPHPGADLRPTERFYRDAWLPLCLRWRYVVLAAFGGLMLLGGVYTLRLEPPAEEDVWFPRRHVLQRALTLTSNSGVFAASEEDNVQPLKMVWGLAGMDTSRVGRWQVEDRGRLVVDPAFDPASPEAQEHLLGACDVARAWPCGAAACPGGRLVRRGECSSAYEGLRDHLAARYPDDETRRLGRLPRGDFLAEVRAFAALPETRRRWPGQLGVEVDGDTGEAALLYVALEATTGYVPPTSPSRVREVWRASEALTAELNRAGPRGADRSFSYMPHVYRWMITQEAFVDGAVQGVSLVFALALAVLVLATGNLWVSLLATVAVAGIVCTVMGTFANLTFGWSLGIAEAIAIVILVGFSMDYVLHIAGSYVESGAATRVGRTRDALTHMGISITAGAATTLVSALFLFGATMAFFQVRPWR